MSPAPLLDLAFAVFRRIESLVINKPPTAQPAQTGQSADGLVTGQLNATDPDGDPLTYQVSADPTHGTASVAADGSYTYTPDPTYAHSLTAGGANTPALDTFTVTVDDSRGFHLLSPQGHTTAIPVSVTVTPINHAPTVQSTATHSADGTTTITVSTADGDADPVTTSAVAIDAHGTLTAINGRYTYTPDATYAHSLSVSGANAAGTDIVVITATDGHGGNATTASAVTITPNNADPVAGRPTIGAPDAATGAVTGNLEFTDPDVDPLSYKITTLQTKGTLTVNTDGTFTYTPSETARQTAAATTTPVTDGFTVTADDGHGGSATQTVSVTVLPATNLDTTAPTAGDPAFTVLSHDFTTGVVSGTLAVIDPHHQTLTYTLTAPPPSGAVTVDPTTGNWTYTPTKDALIQSYVDGGDNAAFTITATNTNMVAAPVTVTASTAVDTTALVAIAARHGSTPSAVAVGPDGTIYVTNSGANTLSLIDPTTNTITKTVQVGRTPQAVTIGTDGNVWIANSGDRTVTITNPAGTTLHTVTVGQTPSAITLGADGTAYVANKSDGTVSVINPTSYTVARTITVGATPTGIATGPDGRIYTANHGDGTITVIDPANGYTTATITLDDINPYGITVLNDGTIAVTDPLRDAVTTLAPTPAPTGHALARVDALSTTSNTTTNNGGNLVVSDGGSNYASSTIAVAGTPTAITHDGANTLYTTDTGGGSVHTINAQHTTSTIQTGIDPNGVAIAPNGTAYISNGGSDNLTNFNPQSGSTTTIPVGVDPFIVTKGLNGELLVVSKTTGTLQVYSSTAAVTNYDATATSAVSNGGNYAIAVDTSGHVIIAGPGRINVFNRSGKLIATGSGTGVVGSMAVASQGKLYVQTDSDSFTGGSVMVADLNDVDQPLINGRPHDLSFVGLYSNGGDTPAIGPSARALAVDGNEIYVVTQGDAQTSTIVVLSPDGSVLRTLPNPTGSFGGLDVRMTVGTDGRLYVTHGRSTVLTVVDPEHDYAESTVDLGGDLDGAAVAANGKIFVLADNAPQVTVLNPDLTRAAVLPIGVGGREILTGSDGRIYVTAGTNSVVVVDPDTYNLGSATLSGNPGAVAADPAGGGIYVAVGNSDGNSITSTATRVGVAPTNIDVPSKSIAPTSLRGLYDQVREVTDDHIDYPDDVYVQTVSAGDGKSSRLIVYLGGTRNTVGGAQSALANFPTAGGQLKPAQINAIKDAVAACNNDSSCGRVDEIMFVGFSQGGMDAQNLATETDDELGWNESLRSKVTTVITFGSPIVASKPSAVAELNVQDTGDNVPGLVLIPPTPFSGDVVQAATGRPSAYFHYERFNAQYIQDTLDIGTSGQPNNDPGTWYLGNHTNKATYQTLADEVTYDKPGQDPKVRDAITRFQGTLITPGVLSGGGNGNGGIA